MKIIPFPKNRWTGGPYPEGPRSEQEDFEQEIELTRKNQGLMEMLEGRARYSAAVSLAEIKKQINLD